MQRFFVDFPLSLALDITDVSMFHQITRVLRMTVNDTLVLFNGDGTESIYEVTSITKRVLQLRFQSKCSPRTEPTRHITLIQAFPNKVEKLEFILQKGVEVGIGHFIFFRSDFSQKLPLSEAKRDRLQSIAREALEQCGGVLMPKIEFFDTFPERGGTGEENIALDTLGAAVHLKELPNSQSVRLWVGPEGGWSKSERSKMKDNGFIFVRFGERIMRTETAGIVTAFSMLHQ